MSLITEIEKLSQSVISPNKYVNIKLMQGKYPLSDYPEDVQVLQDLGIDPTNAFSSRLSENGRHYLARPFICNKDGVTSILFSSGQRITAESIPSNYRLVLQEGEYGDDLILKRDNVKVMVIPVYTSLMEGEADPTPCDFASLSASILTTPRASSETKSPKFLEHVKSQPEGQKFYLSDVQSTPYEWEGKRISSFTIQLNDGQKYSVNAGLGRSLSLISMEYPQIAFTVNIKPSQFGDYLELGEYWTDAKYKEQAESELQNDLIPF